MKDKEKLLSFDTPLKFIFSHSALREGWDNPNVFQICTLRDMGTERERRQTIGRGLRLCVNQSGERLRGFEVNTLTVIATESYEQFAENLQKEIEEDTGIRFGIVESTSSPAIPRPARTASPRRSGRAVASAVGALEGQGLHRCQGPVQDALKNGPQGRHAGVPGRRSRSSCPRSWRSSSKLAGGWRSRTPTSASRSGPPGGAPQPEFKALWDRIKHKTTYRVQFDNEKLSTDLHRGLRCTPAITKTRLQWRKADVAIGQGRRQAKRAKTSGAHRDSRRRRHRASGLLTELQDRTQLTRRRSIASSATADGWTTSSATRSSSSSWPPRPSTAASASPIVDGIKYQRIGDERYYAQELFEQEELTGYLRTCSRTPRSRSTSRSSTTPTPRAVRPTTGEERAVKVYAKLPGWFKSRHPWGLQPRLGHPGREDGSSACYFVVETKSSLFTDDLRDKESAKIECGKAHFGELMHDGDNPARFIKATKLDDVLART
jgi:type III restriction enzyme